MGPRAGLTLRRRGDALGETADWALGPCHARQDGFDLQAAVRIPAGHRDTLERICTYALRPPVATDRLRLTPDGHVLLELKRRWSDDYASHCTSLVRSSTPGAGTRRGRWFLVGLPPAGS